MINKLCKACIKTCKQSDSAKIVNCPKFKKKPSDKEFHEMINELENSENKAKKLQKNVRELIHRALSRNSFESDDSEEKK